MLCLIVKSYFWMQFPYPDVDFLQGANFRIYFELWNSLCIHIFHPLYSIKRDSTNHDYNWISNRFPIIEMDSYSLNYFFYLKVGSYIFKNCNQKCTILHFSVLFEFHNTFVHEIVHYMALLHAQIRTLIVLLYRQQQQDRPN